MGFNFAVVCYNQEPITKKECSTVYKHECKRTVAYAFLLSSPIYGHARGLWFGHIMLYYGYKLNAPYPLWDPAKIQ